MRELIEDDVRDRICGLFGGVQGGPPPPGAAKFVVQFDSPDRRAKQPNDGRHCVTFDDASSLVELCVQARYRGRAWASAWVRAVYMHGAEFLVSLESDTPNLTWLRHFLSLVHTDPELRPGNPNRRLRFVWYIEALEPYAPAPLTATQRNCALVDIARFYERAYEQLKLVDVMAKASARNLAFLAAERTFDYVVAAEHPITSAISTSRAAVRRRASKARGIAAA